jgi:putative nucleotidyltransferase with HDIG domain
MTVKDSFFRELFLIRSIDILLEVLAREVQKKMGARETFLYTHDPEEGTLRQEGAGRNALFPINEDTVQGRCALYSAPVVINSDDKIRPDGATACAAVPLYASGQVIGVLEARNCDGDFSGEKLALLEEMAESVSPALIHILAREDLASVTQHMEELAIQAVDRVSPQGEGHVMRVAQIASGLATYLDVSQGEKEKIWLAAVYHDIGYVLQSAISRQEIEALHPYKGAEFMETMRAHRRIAPLIREHHRLYDSASCPPGELEDEAEVSPWVLSLAEALEGHITGQKGTPFEEVIRKFYASGAEAHHPQVLDALALFIESGKLQKLYEREGR